MATRRGQLELDGFVHLSGFLDPRAVATIAAELDRFDRPPHLCETPAVAEVLFSDRVVSLATELLGDDPVAFPDHAIQLSGGSFGYHKDNVDRLDPTGPDWDGPYRLLRFGVYLEDYAGRSGSLAVQPGSHRGVHYAGRAVNVATRPGDLVVWYSTLTHAANSPAWGWAPSRAVRVPVNNRQVAKLTCQLARRSWPGVLPWPTRRRVVFFPFAARSLEVARFVSLVLHRRYYRDWLRADPARGSAPAQCGLPWFNPFPLLDRADPELVREGFYQSVASAAAGQLADLVTFH